MATPYRADQIGSLLRLPELLQARMAHKQGHMPLEPLRQVEDRAILQAMERQRQIGLDVLTDGGTGVPSFASFLTRRSRACERPYRTEAVTRRHK